MTLSNVVCGTIACLFAVIILAELWNNVLDALFPNRRRRRGPPADLLPGVRYLLPDDRIATILEVEDMGDATRHKLRYEVRERDGGAIIFQEVSIIGATRIEAFQSALRNFTDDAIALPSRPDDDRRGLLSLPDKKKRPRDPA